MKKIIKCYWPFLFGLILCLPVLYIMKSKGGILDQTVITSIINRALEDKALKTDYLIYLIKLRGSQIFFLICMRLLKKERLGLNIWLWMSGIGIGVGIFYLITVYQNRGLIFLAGLLFPQYFLYLYACQKYLDIDSNGQNKRRKRRGKQVYIAKKMLIMLVVIIGLLSEYYVNPFIIKFFKKFIYVKNYNI